MYLDFKTLNLTENIDDIFAHNKEDKNKETLHEHSKLTKTYLNKLIRAKNLSGIINFLLKTLSSKNQELLKTMFYNAVYLHDLGKINPSFQRGKMNNELFPETTESSNHSKLSAQKYVDLFYDKIQSRNIEDEQEYYSLIFILYTFAYQISKHHGRLTSFDDFLLKKDNNFQNAKNSLQKLNIPKFELYILNKLLFSLLVSSDYYATTEYMADLKSNDFGVFNDKMIDQLIDRFENSNIVKQINDFKVNKYKFSDEDINKLRTEMFIESETNLMENLDKNIFYLEAPTGSGKTITSINLALKLLKNKNKTNKLFYIFPFNTLVEQTKKTFDEIFTDIVDVEVVNSITPLKKDKEDKQEYEETKYENAYINRLFFHSPIILTTHISLFNILFGTSKEDNYPLWQLANSVIIIDEIQSYNNNLWWYMIEFFQKYAKLLNITMIIMSATLPKLDNLLDKSSGFVDLIKNREYFFGNKLFKERVKIDFSLLKNESFQDSDELRKNRINNLLKKIKEEIKNYNKILIEFIKKDTARDFYNELKNSNKEFEIFELTGDDNKAYREFVISKTRKNIKIIIIATQVIEAGVDIDMDIGFKDISTIDSEEQFMGRVNRSCKKENSKVYFFYLDDEQKVYRGDNRLELNLRDSNNFPILREKNFQDFYKNVLNRIKRNGNSVKQGVYSEIENFKNYITTLNYAKISKTMTLINSQNYTLYFPFKIDISQYKIKEFENIDSSLMTGNFLDGKKVWIAFNDLNKIENFSEMKYKKSKINSLIQFFTFNIIKYNNTEFPCKFDEEIGGIYYIKEYHDYITDDLKFIRKKYIEDCNDNFY